MKKYLFDVRYQMVAVALMAVVAQSFGILDFGHSTGFALIGAVVATKAGALSNRDAIPSLLSNRVLCGGVVQHARGVCAVANGDSIASKLFFANVPSNALLISLRVSAPDIGTTTAMDLGLYRTTVDGGAVVDVDFFKAALSLNGGAISKSEQLFGNVVTVANSEKMLWQHLGLSADPRTSYDIVGTLTGAADAAGAVLVETDYAV